MIDRERLAGCGTRRVAAGAGELAADLVIVQHAAVAVVGHLDLVGLCNVSSRSEVAADPGRQPSPGVGADGQGCPVEGPEGLVDPVEVLASVRGEEGVRHAEFEDAELGARLQMNGLPDVHFETGVVPRDPLAGVAVDRRHVALSLTPETPNRLLGARAVRDLPGPVGVGPPRVHHSLRAGAASDVVTLALTHRAAPEELGHDLAQDHPHFQSRSAPPSAYKTSRTGASSSG